MVERTRTLGFKIAFAIGLGTMIAAGIFSLSGTAVYRIGSSAVVAFVLAALVAGVTAAAYSEFASIYSENGGGYLFSSRTFPDRDFLTYFVGASLFLGYTGTTAFYLATMDEWFFRFILPASISVPGAGAAVPVAAALPHGSVGIVAALALGYLNARGTEESGAFQLIVTSAKVAILLVFVGGAVSFAGPVESASTFAAGFEFEPVNIASVAALAFITFFGFSAIAASAGEIIEPRKTVPRAIAASMVTVTVLYVFVIVAMLNAPVPRAVLAEGETAMGTVAASFLGPVGQSLIVAGAVFSMVSASNASVLAATGIGALMGRRGQAPRRFGHIHPTYGTPNWSVTTATATIVGLVFVFVTLFGHEGVVGAVALPAVRLPVVGVIESFALGLTPLTGFATFNLLVPLAVVNVALVASRRRFPDLERGFRMPLVPLLPAIGVLANLALVTNLPPGGVGVGVASILVLVAAFAWWGGAPEVEELVEQVVEARPGPGGAGAGETGAPAAESTERDTTDEFRVLVPVARPERAPGHVALAAHLARRYRGEAVVQVLNVTHVPDQTPSEMVVETARERTAVIEEELAAHEFGVEYTVEGHVCRDVAFDILRTARDDRADRILMGYPEDHPDVAETVEYRAPCDVLFTRGFGSPRDLDVVTVGAGGGPHHRALLPLVNELGEAGTEVHVVGVTPDRGGSPESLDETVAELPDCPELHVHNVEAATVASGLVSTAAETGGVLFIGATRDRRLRRWVFGSTPDRVIDLAAGADVPVVVYASETGVGGHAEDLVYPVYRYLRRRLQRGDGAGAGASAGTGPDAERSD